MKRADVTDALLATLTTVTSPHPIGDGTVPPPAAGSSYPAMPYAIVYALDGGQAELGPPLGDAGADAALPYQVTCVGLNREQAEMMADLVDGAVVGRTASGWAHAITPATSTVAQRERILSGGLTWEGELAQVARQYVLYVTA